jgi:hypothetical protein
MSETATAEAGYYSHTLTHREYYPPAPYKPDPRLTDISANLLSLPTELRAYIYHLAFHGNRVAVTSRVGCYCASTHTGRYRDDHHWLLNLPAGSAVRNDAQRGFVAETLWEVHCPAAFDVFVRVMRRARALDSVRHLLVNVFDTSTESWVVQTERFSQLRSVTFAPWQKGWTIDVPALLGTEEMSDRKVMEKVRAVVDTKHGYGFVRDCLQKGRHGRGGWTCHFLFPIRYLSRFSAAKRSWALKVRSDGS